MQPCQLFCVLSRQGHGGVGVHMSAAVAAQSTQMGPSGSPALVHTVWALGAEVHGDQ
jgi:hypothetical protein